MSISGTRAKVSNEQIDAAIEQLNAEGVKPTIRAVRERLGAGSPNRIQPLLAAWKEKSHPVETAAAVLGENLQQALGELFARERSAAVASKLEDIGDLKEQISELASEGTRLEDENAALQEQSEALIAEQAQAVAVAGQQAQRIEQLEKELLRLQQQAQQQTQELATALAKLDMQQQQQQQTQQQLEQAQARKAELGQAVAVAQQSAAVAEAKQQAGLEVAGAAQKRIEKLEQQLEQAQAAAAVKLDALQQRLDDALQQRTKDAQAHAQQLGQRDEQLHVEHRKNAELMTKIDELTDMLSTATKKSTNRIKEG